MKRYDVPPVWLLGGLVLATGLDYYWPILPFDGGHIDALAMVLLLVGVGLIGASARYFRRFETTIHPNGTPSVLIVSGTYRISRNPIYLGMAIILAAVAISLGSLLPLCVVVLFITLISKRFIEPEEARLRQEFGVEAEKYLVRTRRWL